MLATPQIAAGKLRALATTGEKRFFALPDTPTLVEQGTRTYPTYSWWGIYAPTGTPRPVIDRMYQEVMKALQAPDIQKIWEEQGAVAGGQSPAEFGRFVHSEVLRWGKVVKDANIRIDN